MSSSRALAATSAALRLPFAPFVAVERFVRADHQVLDRTGPHRVETHRAHAEHHLVTVVSPRIVLFDVLLQTGGDHPCAVIVGVDCNHYELVAAEPRDDVGLAKGLP